MIGRIGRGIVGVMLVLVVVTAGARAPLAQASVQADPVLVAALRAQLAQVPFGANPTSEQITAIADICAEALRNSTYEEIVAAIEQAIEEYILACENANRQKQQVGAEQHVCPSLVDLRLAILEALETSIGGQSGLEPSIFATDFVDSDNCGDASTVDCVR